MTYSYLIVFLHAMQSLRFSKEDIENVRCILGAILHLGNVKIDKDSDGESSKVANFKPVSAQLGRRRGRERGGRKREGEGGGGIEKELVYIACIHHLC